MTTKTWTSQNLDEIFEFKNGINANKEQYGRGTKFINIMEVINNQDLTSKDIPGTVEIDKAKAELYSVRFGDVLFNRTSETQDEVALSSVYVDTEPVTFGGFVIRARPKNGSLDPHYCKYCFREKSIRDQIIKRGQGAIRANIGQKDLGTVTIAVPPISEQKKIAEILSAWDRAIKLAEVLSNRSGIYLKIQLNDFFNRLMAIGDTSTVSELCEVKSGGTPSRSKNAYYEGTIPWLKSGEVRQGEIFEADEFITEEGLKNSAAKVIPENSPVVAMYGATAGQVGIIRKPMAINQAIAAIIPNHEKMDAEYLYLTLRFLAPNLLRKTQGSGQPNLNAGMIKSLTIPICDLAQQKLAAQFIMSIFREEKALNQLAITLKKQKQGLMQKLLTGKVRVKV